MICDHCGKPVENKSAERFCDRDCYFAYRREHPEEFGQTKKTYTCEYCGKPGIERKPSEVRNHVYCSRECSNKAQSETLRNHPEWREEKGIPLDCANCGETFYVKPHRADTAKYCSKACAAAARFGRPFELGNRPDVSGSNNPNYKGNGNLTTARKVAHEAFGVQCMICGFDAIVHVHHIHPRSSGGTNELTNLIVLCPNHHAMAHRQMIPQKQLIKINRAAIAQLSESQLQSRQPEDS